MSALERKPRTRHMPGHAERKRTSARMMRRATRQALRNGTEPPARMPGMASQWFCCGNHPGDWRY